MIYVTKQLILKVNQNILNPNLIHREKLSVVVEELKFIRPDNKKIDYIIHNCNRDCYNKFFHTFKIKSIYDIEMTNGDFVNGIISDKKLKKKCSGKWFNT